MIESDWIELLVKFRGKCSSCGKVLIPGDRAFWSKISKSIKHIDCYYEYYKKFEKQKELEPLIKTECILCKSSNFFSKDIGYYNEDNIQQEPFIICPTCIEDPNCYIKYQQFISEKMKRIVRLKS
ncbi:MAG: hypothetical protein ACE5SW_00115 [Nitrososphaeraceae archaeon]